MTRKVFIRTLGREINEYDSDKMLDLLVGTESVAGTNGVEMANIINYLSGTREGKTVPLPRPRASAHGIEVWVLP